MPIELVEQAQKPNVIRLPETGGAVAQCCNQRQIIQSAEALWKKSSSSDKSLDAASGGEEKKEKKEKKEEKRKK